MPAAAGGEKGPDITAVSLPSPQEQRQDQEPMTTSQSSASSTSKGEAPVLMKGPDAVVFGAEDGDDHDNPEAGGMSRLTRITTSFGARPDCFKNTFQEVAFVMQATVATASSAFLSGTALIITVPVSLDLGMTQGQISWISASTSCVTFTHLVSIS